MSVTILNPGTENEQISYDQYVKKGNMMCLREALSINDPDHLYNYLKNNGVVPEKYGVYHPIYHQYKDYTYEQLLNRVVELEQQLSNVEQFL